MKELNFIAIFYTMERTVLLNQTAYSFIKIQLNVDMDSFVENEDDIKIDNLENID